MKVVGLLSGGKDSCYNLCHAAKQGHTLVAVATLAPPAGKGAWLHSCGRWLISLLTARLLAR